MGFRWAAALAVSLSLSACINWERASSQFCQGNARCNQVWSEQLGTSGNETPSDIACAANGDIFLTGSYTGAANLGGSDLGNQGGRDLFLAQYGRDGSHKWSHGYGGTGDDEINALSLDSSETIYATGDFSSSTLSFGAPSALTLAGIDDCLVTQFAPAGQYGWAASIGASNARVVGRGIFSGNGTPAVLITGNYTGTVTFAGMTESPTSEAFFLVSATAKGAVDNLIASASCASGRMGGEAVAQDSAANIYVTGWYEGSCSAFGTNLPNNSQGNPGLFTARLRPTGEVIWIAAHPTANLAIPVQIRVAVDASDNLLLVTSFKGSIQLSNGSFVQSLSSSASDAVVLKYERLTGNVLWGETGGGSGDDFGFGLAVDSQKTAWITGAFSGSSATFSGTSLTALGSTNVFVAHYSENGDLLNAAAYGGPGRQTGRAIAIHPQGVVIAGDFSGQLNLGSKVLQTANTDIFLALLQF